MSDGLLFETSLASSVINTRVYRVFDASFLLSLFAIIPAIERAYKIASDAAQALKLATKILIMLV